MSELLPCPFCGGKAYWRQYRTVSRIVRCMGCDTCGAPYDTEDEAIAAWNQRAINSEIEEYKTMIRVLTEKMEEMSNIYKKVD